ncbi:MAG: mechanosensitive ion channel [Bacteroidota bacterium]|nr:mechanosensitive ion channel [Bacteroidota bacterium]
MRNSISIFIFALFIFINQNLYAQNDTIKKKDSINLENDSLNAVLLQDYSKKIGIIEQQRIDDSVKKAELQVELNSLKTTDNLKKKELQKQLQELNDKQAERIAEKKAQIDSLRHIAKGYPVIGFFKDTLFLIFNKSGSFSAEDRASAISNRIHNLADNFNFRPDSLQLLPNETTTDVVFRDNTIMSVSENDALWNNLSRDSLGRKYQQIIRDAIKQYRSETSLRTLAKEIGLALLVLAIIIFLVKYIGRFFKWTSKKIEFQEGRGIKGIKIKNYTLFDAKQQVKVLLTVNTILKWFFILLAIYIALPILFGIFPWTKNFATTLFGYILNPVKKMASGLWNYLPNLITIIVIIFVFRYLLKGIHFLKDEIQRGNLRISGFYPDWANPTYQIIRVLLFAFMFIVIFPYLPGSNSQVFRGVSVFLGVLFTFGSTGSLSNVIAGLVLTYMRLFKIGDRVKIGDVTGDVIEKSMLVTRIRTIKNEIISIPNSTVMSSHTINYSSDAPDKGLIIHTTVTIGYDTPWRDMHQALIDAASKTELVLNDPKPFVLQTSLDDFYVSYQINAYIREANKQAEIYSNLHQNIQDVCNERGIEILSPHYNQLRDGNMVTIPADYLKKDYKAPTFDIKIMKEENGNNGETI